MELNGLKFKEDYTTDAEAQCLLEELLMIAEQEFNYKVIKIEHSNPKLVRYLYKQCLGTDHSEATREKHQAQSFTQFQGKQHYDQMGSGASSSSSKAPVPIKFENEELRVLAETKIVLESAKVALGKRLLQAQDLGPYITKVGGFEISFDACVDGLGTFLHELRAFLVSLTPLPGAEFAAKALKQADEFKAKAFVHQDGMKAKSLIAQAR